MPRTNLDKPKFPPINNLRAAILERKFVGGYSWEEIAKSANISYGTMRTLVSKLPPEEWPTDVRRSVCRFLQIRVTQTVVGEYDLD